MPIFTDYRIWDADQHYSEPLDSFTAYIDPAFRDRTFRSVTGPDGAEVFMAGPRPIPVDEEQFGKVGKPGSLKELLRNIKKGGGDNDSYEWIDPPVSFLEPQARVDDLDSLHVEGSLLFSSQGLFAESCLRDDPDLLYASLWAHARWLHEQWGFAYQDRLFPAVEISLRDVDRAVELLDWLLERGARAIQMRPGPAFGRSPGDAHFDPFWARVNEAKMLVCYHGLSNTDYNEERGPAWGQNAYPRIYEQSAWQWTFCWSEQPMQETIAALIYDNLFARFPNLQILSAENGTEWAPSLARRLDKMRGMGRNGPWIGGQLTERPSEIFKRHFKLSPFWEDDIIGVIEHLGPQIIMGGSDYPHPEGLADPTELVEHLKPLTEAEQRLIMRDSLQSILLPE